MHSSPRLKQVKRNLISLSCPADSAPEPEPPRPTFEGIRARLRELAPKPGQPVFDFHGFVEITSNVRKEISIHPSDRVLFLPRGTRTREQRNELLNHSATVWKCRKAKKDKKEATRRKKLEDRCDYEAEIQRSGGTVGKLCKGGDVHYCADARERRRRSKAMTAINAMRARFRARLNLPATANLPPPRQLPSFRTLAEALAYDVTLGQLLPTVDLVYPETESWFSPHRYSEVACTWAGNISYWERDFDISFTLADETTLAAQLQCKGLKHWFKGLYDSLASSDRARHESSAPFITFYRTFRRMSHFAIRHLVNELQVAYQSRGDPLPLLYASYSSLKEWRDTGLRVDSAEALLALYETESVAFYRRFERLFLRVFPRERQLLEYAFRRTIDWCENRKEFYLSLSAEGIAEAFARFLKEVKAEVGYKDDREECRFRFEALVEEVNRRAGSSSLTREQALYHMLPRKPRKGP